MTEQDETNVASVVDNPAAHRYEVSLDGAVVGFSAYRDEAGKRVFTHTEIAEEMGGRGLGSQLARAALADTRAQGLAIVARCPFIAEYLRRHPE